MNSYIICTSEDKDGSSRSYELKTIVGKNWGPECSSTSLEGLASKVREDTALRNVKQPEIVTILPSIKDGKLIKPISSEEMLRFYELINQ